MKEPLYRQIRCSSNLRLGYNKIKMINCIFNLKVTCLTNGDYLIDACDKRKRRLK